MTNNEQHWLIATNQLCPIIYGKPSYIKREFTKEVPYKQYHYKESDQLPNIDHLIKQGLSVNDIVAQMDRGSASITRAKDYVYERKRQLGYRRKSKHSQALEMMKDKKITDQDIADKLGMHKRYVRFLRVGNSRGKL